MSATILTYNAFTVITPVLASYVMPPPLYKLLLAEPEAGIIIGTMKMDCHNTFPVMPVSNLQYPGMDEDDGFIPPIFSKIGSANFFRTESAPTI